MKNLLFLSLLLVHTATMAAEKGLFLSYRVDSVVVDKSIPVGSSAGTFTFKSYSHILEPTKVLYSIDEKSFTEQLDEKSCLNLSLTPGKHVFQFVYAMDFYEISTDSIDFQVGKRTHISLFFMEANSQIIVDKPVIYLYPELKMNIDVKVIPVKQFTFTYPTYENGWKVTADSNGSIQVKGRTYNYLFWEAEQSLTSEMMRFKEGFVLQNTELLPFFETKLDEFGLTSKEKADFITYWIPKMLPYENNFVHFYFDEECDIFGKLTVDPAPQNLHRIYLFTQPIPFKENLKIAPQQIKPIKRNGFTVIEWGGTQLINKQAL